MRCGDGRSASRPYLCRLRGAPRRRAALRDPRRRAVGDAGSGDATSAGDRSSLRGIAHVRHDEGRGEVFVAPTDVILSGTTIVQPDIIWVGPDRPDVIS